MLTIIIRMHTHFDVIIRKSQLSPLVAQCSISKLFPLLDLVFEFIEILELEQ